MQRYDEPVPAGIADSPAGNQAGKLADRVRGMAAPTWEAARDRLSRMGDDLRIEARSTAYQAQRYARENPWRVAAAAALVSLVVGYVIGSQRPRRTMLRR